MRKKTPDDKSHLNNSIKYNHYPLLNHNTQMLCDHILYK